MNSTTYRKGPHTSMKQKSFSHAACRIFWAIKAVYTKYKIDLGRKALYLDFFAGRGRDPDTGEPGSPLVIAKLASSLPYPIEAHLYERDPESVRALAANLTLSPFWSDRFIIHPEENMKVVDVLAEIGNRDSWDYYGLAYSDVSNGDIVAATNPLRLVAERQPRVDLLINYAATSWKRQRNFDHYRYISEILPTVGKAYWFIRKPLGAHQFAMLLGSNYRIPFGPKENIPWYLLSSEEGKYWFDKINFSRSELDDLNQPLLF